MKAKINPEWERRGPYLSRKQSRKFLDRCMDPLLEPARKLMEKVYEDRSRPNPDYAPAEMRVYHLCDPSPGMLAGSKLERKGVSKVKGRKKKGKCR